jgi:hypothetical protein
MAPAVCNLSFEGVCFQTSKTKLTTCWLESTTMRDEFLILALPFSRLGIPAKFESVWNIKGWSVSEIRESVNHRVFKSPSFHLPKA